MRLRRTLVWVNGNDKSKLQAAIASNVDCIVLDLEDGVALPEKPEARRCAMEFLSEWDFKGKERVLRINPMDSDQVNLDYEVVEKGLPDAIRLPKCEDTGPILRLDSYLGDLEKKKGLAPNTIEIILMIETPLGIMRVYDMASCCERVTAVGVGMEDLTASMGVMRHYELGAPDLLYARQKMILEARAAGIQALDSGTLFNGDPEYMLQDSILDRRHGFDGRSVGDLAHVDVVNKAFTPSDEQADWAKRIIEAYARGVAEGRSDVYVDGKFVDPPVVSKAEAIQERLRLIEEKKRKGGR